MSGTDAVDVLGWLGWRGLWVGNVDVLRVDGQGVDGWELYQLRLLVVR